MSTRRNFLASTVVVAGEAVVQDPAHAADDGLGHRVLPSDSAPRVKALELSRVQEQMVEGGPVYSEPWLTQALAVLFGHTECKMAVGGEVTQPVALFNRAALTAIVASTLGWSLDFFDLLILLYVAPAVGKAFFPSDSPTLSVAAVYASFAVTLFMRPVGSALFGNYADRHGRKGAMIVAVIGVGLATAAFGLLPTLAQIGIAAPLLFLLLRLLQGIFVGGVVASTHTIGTESVAPQWRGLMSGFINGGGVGMGALFASIAFFIASSIFPGIPSMPGAGASCFSPES